jgi:hypothetical protein
MVSVSVFAKQQQDFASAFPMDVAPSHTSNHAHAYSDMQLKRSGMRPVRCRGREVAAASSHSVGPSFWYQLNLVETDSSQMLIDLRCYQKDEAFPDTFQVIETSGIDESMAWLESYDPASDIVPRIDLMASHLSPAELAIEAAALKLKIIEARRQYKEMVGEILHGIEA